MDDVLSWAIVAWLLVLVLGAGTFGMAVEIFGPEWVDELWDRIQRGRR